MTTPDIPHDPETAFARVISLDLARVAISKRVLQAMAEFVRTYGLQPTWARVSFDLVTAAGEAVLAEPCTILGLEFRLELAKNNWVEVGSSCLGKEELEKQRHQPETSTRP